MEYNLFLSNKRYLIADIVFTVFIYFIPSISHMLSFPLYLFDPMRLSVLGSYLLLRSRNNSLFLAMTLPLVSFLLSGHPIAIKNMIIAIELVMNVLLIDVFFRSKIKTFYATLLSITLSKAVYYFLKTTIVYWGLLQTSIIDTNMFIQLGVTVVISVLFAKFYERDCEVVR